MKKSELIKILQEIDGDFEIRLEQPSQGDDA